MVLQAVSNRKVVSAHVPHPLVSVFSWELRNIAANRGNWLLILVAFGFFIAIVWLRQHATTLLDAEKNIAVQIAGTSAWGAVLTIGNMLLAFGLFLPFITTDLVAQDWRRRTNEIIMATSVPSLSYVGGRYLAGLFICLVLALLMLLAILVLGLVLWLWFAYPPPNVPAVAAIWAVSVLPPIVFLTSLSFTLGTLFPRISSFIKVAIISLWFVLAVFLRSPVIQSPVALFFDPVSSQMSQAISSEYRAEYDVARQSTTTAEQATQVAREVEQRMPDLRPWLGYRSVLVAMGIALVLLAGFGFQRFRNVLNKGST